MMRPMIEDARRSGAMTFALVCCAGIALRFIVMTLGHNFDFESYCIVGDIASKMENVYASTGRYNYGPIFFCIQGLLYKLTQYFTDHISAFRVSIVALLTAADLGIAIWIKRYRSERAAAIFFLNPISIIITGYHNQFDNIAVLTMLMAAPFYSETPDIKKRDLAFVLLCAVSLITKHIFFLFPLWLLFRRSLPLKKRLVYAVAPPVIFLLSFVPFVVGSEAALQGVLKNVFFYRSFNNAPLLFLVYRMIDLPSSLWFAVFMAMMAAAGFMIRDRDGIGYVVLFYTLCVVSFSSAIANQYLAIPTAALCVISACRLRYLYLALGGLYLCTDANGAGMIGYVKQIFGERLMGHDLAAWNTRAAYSLSALILFVIIARELYAMRRKGAASGL